MSSLFSREKFHRSVDGNKEKHKNYLADLFSWDKVLVLPKEIIPNHVTLNALCFTHKKNPSILPILLRYFTHKNLLEEAKDDLDKINQKLQSVMDEDLNDLQNEQKLLEEGKTRLNNVEIHSEEAKALATDKINKLTLPRKSGEKVWNVFYKENDESKCSGMQ